MGLKVIFFEYSSVVASAVILMEQASIVSSVDNTDKRSPSIDPYFL